MTDMAKRLRRDYWPEIIRFFESEFARLDEEKRRAKSEGHPWLDRLPIAPMLVLIRKIHESGLQERLYPGRSLYILGLSGSEQVPMTQVSF